MPLLPEVFDFGTTRPEFGQVAVSHQPSAFSFLLPDVWLHFVTRRRFDRRRLLNPEPRILNPAFPTWACRECWALGELPLAQPPKD